MSSAYVPYNGTAGWSGTDTSKERALHNLRTGKEYNNQEKALVLLKQVGNAGLTWKEFGIAAEVHHGTASGVLSVLHKSGAILRTTRIRNGCKVYMHIMFTDKIEHEVYVQKTRTCPHCGLDTNT